MKHAPWRVLRTRHQHVPAIRQKRRLVSQDRIQYVLIGIFRAPEPCREFTASVENIPLPPALQVHKAHAAAAIPSRIEAVQRDSARGAPRLELHYSPLEIAHPLDRGVFVPQFPKFRHIAPPDGVHVGIHYPVDIRKEFTEIQPQERHGRTFVGPKLATDSVGKGGVPVEQMKHQPFWVCTTFGQAGLGDLETLSVGFVRRHNDMYFIFDHATPQCVAYLTKSCCAQSNGPCGRAAAAAGADRISGTNRKLAVVVEVCTWCG